MILAVGLYAVSAQRVKAQQRMQALRVERQRIESDLQQVKATVDDTQPVVVLQNGDTRVIVQPSNPYQQTKQVYY